VGLFGVNTISSISFESVDVEDRNIGSYYGGLALSSSKVFVSGDESAIGVLKSNLTFLEGVSTLASASNYTIVSNLATQQLYALLDSDGGLLEGCGYISGLVALDGSTGRVSSGQKIIYLSEEVEFPYGSGIFVGYNRIVIVSGNTKRPVNIDPRSGKVLKL
jgi:hypothetical protein